MPTSPPHTYNPDYIDLIEWLTPPVGNLIWDVVLQALGIFITVAIIERWIEKREEKRWLPLKHQTYILLFMITDSLVRDLSPYKASESQTSLYFYFGQRAVFSSLSEEFGNKLLGMEDESFRSRAKEILARHPQPLEIYKNYREFQGVLERGSVILSREPELSNLVANLDLTMTLAIDDLAPMLETADEDKEDLVRRAEPIIVAGNIKWVAKEAYRLHEWLKRQADTTSAKSALVEQRQDKN